MLALEAGQFPNCDQLPGEGPALLVDDPETLNHLAEACLGQGDLERALSHYRRLVELCPQSAKAYTDLALTEERVGNLQAAADAYRRALALEPGSPCDGCT